MTNVPFLTDNFFLRFISEVFSKDRSFRHTSESILVLILPLDLNNFIR